MKRYYKYVDGQIKISYCRTLTTESGEKISNPTEEQILAEGWLPYNPPPFVPPPQEEPDYDLIVQAVKKMFSADTEEMTDEEALQVASLYPTWHSRLESGEDCVLNERLWYDGELWKVIQTHTPQADWNPRDAVSLFVRVSIEEWPEWRQPQGAHDAYNAGDKCTHADKHWISNVDGNIWEPGVFGWDEA